MFYTGEVAELKDGFVDREREIKILKEALIDGDKKAAIIHGPPGIGKSVLATRFAAEEAENFEGVKAIKGGAFLKVEEVLRDLNFFLGMAGIEDFNRYLMAPIPLEDKVGALAKALNRKRFLIILDDFTDFWEEMGGLLHGLMDKVTKTKFILTGSQDLKLKEAYHLGLGELSRDSAFELMDSLEGLSSQPDEEKLAIYKALGGNPFSLVLFSRLAREGSVGDLLSELRPRDVSLLLNKAYQRLGKKERDLLERASVFEEATTVDALQWMMEGDIRAELGSLVALGLLSAKDDLYTMHELIKEFVREKVDVKDLRRKAAQYYEDLVTTSRNLWDHLRARDYWYQAGEYERADRIVQQAYNPLIERGHVELALRLLEDSLKTLRGKRKTIAMGNLASVYQRMGDSQRAIGIYERAEKVFREEGDKRNVAAVLHNLGAIFQEKGDYMQALEKYEESLKISEEIGDKTGVGTSLHNLGAVYHVLGDYRKAKEKYEESLEIAREQGDKGAFAQTLYQLGKVHEADGSYREALEKFSIALGAFKDMNSPKAEMVEDSIRELERKMG